jgi:hypothetical protein
VRLQAIERLLWDRQSVWSTIPQLEAQVAARRTRREGGGSFLAGDWYLDEADDIAPGDDQAGA